MSKRRAQIKRQTKETDIQLELNLDGEGNSRLETRIGFLDHMLTLLSHHALVDLDLKAAGDLPVDDHHLVEDVGIALGAAIAEAVGEKEGINRYGSALLPMDEVLVACALDLSGRPCFVSDYRPCREKVGELSAEMVNHFFKSLAMEARMNLHFRMLVAGENEHHRIEALFKAFARSLRVAVEADARRAGQVPSTKGRL